jgi:hypothetical protein
VHEHEAPEAAERRKLRAETGGGPAGPGLLSLQQQAGNRAVAGAVARAVQIEEMTSNVRTTDNAAPMSPDMEETIQNVVHDTAHAGDDQKGPSSLPPGGHATMEEEPS